MALMKFREHNHVLWRGVRLAHDGTQRVYYDDVDNGLTILRAVPAGTTFFLISANMFTNTVVAGRGALYVRTPAPVTWFYLCYINMQANANTEANHWYSYPPLEVPATYEIVVTSNAAGAIFHGSIFGWEEP